MLQRLHSTVPIVLAVLCHLCTVTLCQQFIFKQGHYHIDVPPNSTLEIHCANPYYYYAYLIKHSTDSAQQRCFLGTDRRLILRLKITDGFGGVFSCRTQKQDSVSIRVAANDEVYGDTLPFKDSDTVASTTDDVINCTDNGDPTTLFWRRGDKVLCKRCPNVKQSPQSSFGALGPILCVIFIVFLLIAVFTIGFVYVRRRSKEIQQLCKLYETLTATDDCAKNPSENSNLLLHQMINELIYDLRYEIRVNRLKIKTVASEGMYGQIYYGELRSKSPRKEFLNVSVKVPKRSAKYTDIKALADELKIFMALGPHPNLLCLIGVVTENLKRGGDLCGIFEDTECVLRTFLRDRRRHFINELRDFKHSIQYPKYSSDSRDLKFTTVHKNLGAPITTSFLNLVSYQIANGMEFLASKKCVHRDLAARNIMVCGNRIIRITGLGQDYQWGIGFTVRTAQHPSPYKHIAPEAICTYQFTEKTDIWSYGVLLWEIYSLGKDPLKHVQTLEKLQEFYAQGSRLSKPDYMPIPICNLMNDCWKQTPDDRPNFSTCKECTANIVKEDSAERYEMLENQLNEQLVHMRQYADWRDGPSHDMIRRRKKGSQHSRTQSIQQNQP